MTFEITPPPSELQVEAAAAAMAAMFEETWDVAKVSRAEQARVLRRCADIVEGLVPANTNRGMRLLAAQSLAPTPGAGGEDTTPEAASPAIVASPSPGEGEHVGALPGPADVAETPAGKFCRACSSPLYGPDDLPRDLAIQRRWAAALGYEDTHPSIAGLEDRTRAAVAAMTARPGERRFVLPPEAP